MATILTVSASPSATSRTAVIRRLVDFLLDQHLTITDGRATLAPDTRAALRHAVDRFVSTLARRTPVSAAA
jgi:hypothetical protein